MKTYHKIKYSSAYGIILCLFLIIPLFQFREAKAEGPSFSIAPHSFNVSALGGEEIRQKIKIINRGDAAIPMRVRVDGFTAKDETGDMVASQGDSQENFIDWFEFEKDSFIIDAGKTENVDFTVKIPVSAPLKGYYAVIFIEADISPFVYNESKVQTIPGIGAPFLLKVGNQAEKGALSILKYQILDEHRLKNFEKAVNFLAVPFFGEEEVAVMRSGEPSFSIRIKNGGIYHSMVSGKIKLSGLGWKLDDEIEIPSTTILPGRTREILIGKQIKEGKNLEPLSAIGIHLAMAAEEEQDSGKSIGFGLMKASLELEAEGGIQKEESRWIFVFSWWLVFLFFAGLLGLIVATVLLFKIAKQIKGMIIPKLKIKSDLIFSTELFTKKNKIRLKNFLGRKRIKKKNEKSVKKLVRGAVSKKAKPKEIIRKKIKKIWTKFSKNKAKIKHKKSVLKKKRVKKVK